jgi:hypothetical protein
MSEKKLSECQLDSNERAQWLSRIDRVLEYAGSPGDWGYKTELGELTIKLIEIRQKLIAA